jgi:hypothetical protein
MVFLKVMVLPLAVVMVRVTVAVPGVTSVAEGVRRIVTRPPPQLPVAVVPAVPLLTDTVPEVVVAVASVRDASAKFTR